MPKRRITPEQIEQAACLRESGWSIPRLACRFDCSEGAMSWHMLAVGADPPKIAGKVLPQTRPGPAFYVRSGHVIRAFYPAEDALILSLAAQGLGATAIGRRLDPPRRPNAIRGRLMTLARHDARREAADA